MKEEGVILSLGSNLGDRLTHLRRGVASLAGCLRIGSVSSVFETAPQGVAPQPDYLNAVIRGVTRLSPQALLDWAREIEDAAGRERPFPGAPRTLDIDLLFFGERVIHEPRLTIPHPRWRDRPFVLVPLMEVAPGWTDPESGRTIEFIWGEGEFSAGEVQPVAPPHALREAL